MILFLRSVGLSAPAASATATATSATEPSSASDDMLEEPRLLLLRALDPLYPLEPPPKASRFPPPLRERSRLPMLIGSA